MKKYFILFLITLSITAQKVSAQLDMAFISDFSVISGNPINRLTWTVANNQGAISIYIERCTNGNDFKTVAVLMATEKFGSENYIYADTAASPDRVMYRLRMLSKNQHTFYSRIFITQPNITSDQNINILGNPVKDKISFNFTSKSEQQAGIRIYNVYGIPLVNEKIHCLKGNNLITIPLTTEFAPGIYVIEINNSVQKLTAQFIKQ